MKFDADAYKRCFHADDTAAAPTQQHVDAQTTESAIEEQPDVVAETTGDPVDDPALDEGGDPNGA